MTTPPRAPGRPRLDPAARAIDVHVSLPPRLYDRVKRVADTHDLTIPEVIRRVLTRTTPEPPS